MNAKSMRLLRYIVLGLAFAVFSATAGIPTVDIPMIAQKLKEYIKYVDDVEIQVKEMKQQGISLRNLKGMHEQQLKEYTTFLKQIEGLKKGDQKLIWEIAKGHYGSSDFSLATEIDNRDPKKYSDDLGAVLDTQEHQPRTPEEVIADLSRWGEVSARRKQEIERDYNQYQRYKDRFAMVQANDDNAKKREDKMETMVDGFDKLGDESQLASIQFLAQQNFLLSQQIEAQTQVLNQLLLNTESPSAREAALRAEAQDEEIERLKNRKPFELYGSSSLRGKR